jgi:hypothetical protein
MLLCRDANADRADLQFVAARLRCQSDSRIRGDASAVTPIVSANSRWRAAAISVVDSRRQPDAVVAVVARRAGLTDIAVERSRGRTPGQRPDSKRPQIRFRTFSLNDWVFSVSGAAVRQRCQLLTRRNIDAPGGSTQQSSGATSEIAKDRVRPRSRPATSPPRRHCTTLPL